ncbi:MAG: outer membrane beta-barrel protein [Flavisolibacter sp.]
MAQRILLIFFCFLTSFQLFAQTRSVSGTIVDRTNNNPLTGASVLLQSLSDSSAQRTLTDSLGSFIFSNLPKDSFLLSVSYVGYQPVLRKFSIDTSDVIMDIGAVSSASSDLETVVIRTSIAPVTQRGDTLQINASQYKVNPDASGEDLVRKVPGITIENGQVKAQGENVQKVTIDGRELFGDDATAALRNLPAEIIDKIQIFDRLSDEAQNSGIDDGNTTKGINIVTKANMRNGQFGRIYAGYGTNERYAAGGNSTFLKENRRISVVGNFNNINQQNFSQQDLLGVTSSNNQRGSGGGGRPQGGGGRPQGGGGGNFGGNNNNFLVGQQNGINKTNAFGINYSDVWNKKITVTGSYFFNNTENATSQIGNIQYLNPEISRIDRILDTTTSLSKNTNHRFNVRFEWKIDSNNQIIITPNLSFQKNSSLRRRGSITYYPTNSKLRQQINENITQSDRSGNNLNNSIFYRHNFPKRGRTFSVNLNTSYNKRDGESYVSSFTENLTTEIDDTLSNRFTDQYSDGLQLSANLSYTEPLGENSQLQFNYRPSTSKSTSNQQAFGQNSLNNKFDVFLDDFSNVFENRTNTHNAGISYRYGNRDRQISFGASYQNTNLNSERIYPVNATLNKGFSNVLPNLQVRYKVSTRSSIRINYRTNVNLPSVTQLQDVLDPTNEPSYSIGNPQLNPQYTQSLFSQYTFTNTGKGLLLVGSIFYQTAKNYITTASFNSSERDTIISGATLDTGYRLSKSVNLDGYNSLRSFLTFAIPLKFIKSNLNLNGGVTLSTLPGMSNYVPNETKNTTYTLGAVIGSNVSQYVDFTVSYSANFSKVRSNIEGTEPSSYFQHVAGLQLNLLTKKGLFFQNDLNNQFYNGLSEGFNQNYFLWNMSVGQKFLKNQRGEIKVGVFDLLKQNRSITRNVTAERIEDEQNKVLTQYFMATFTYNLRNFGTAASRAQNRANNRDNSNNSRF